MKTISSIAAMVVLLGFAAPAKALSPVTEPRHADHEALRGMLKTATNALNDRDYNALQSLFADKFTAVTIDQRKITSFPELKSAFESYFTGDKPLLKKITFNPKADELTEFLGPDAGICHGTSMDTYDFTDGDTRSMASRWSAVVVKQKGAWKVASLHMGVDVADNPILAALKASLYKAGAVGLLVGVLLGAGLAKALSPCKS